MASDALRADVRSANGRLDGASLAARPGEEAGASAGPAGVAASGGDLAGRRFFCSWSGGKDAYLALQRAVAAGGPAALVCMLHEDGRVSRGHGLPLALLEEQAAALGIPLVTRATSWDAYEATFVPLLQELRAQGVEAGVFGDIDLQAHRDWVEGVCGRRPRLSPAAVAGAAPPAAGRVPRRRLPRPSSPSTPPSWAPSSSASSSTTPSSPASRPPAPTPAAKKASTTPWSPAPALLAAGPARWDGIEERDGHHVLRYVR